MKRFPMLGLVLFLAACAPQSRFPTIDSQLAEAEARKQRIETVRAQQRSRARLFAVSHAVMAGNAELCGDKVHKQSGFIYQTLDNFAGEWREAAAHLGVSEHWTVIGVAEGSPSALAGMRNGDRVLSYSWNPEGSEITYWIERDNRRQSLIVRPVVACAYPVNWVPKTQDVAAWATGDEIFVTDGMVQFARTDAELALVVGHELAHNTRGHIHAKIGNQLLGTLLGAGLSLATGVNVTRVGTDIGRLAFSQEFEAEADYIGVYHAARAGYDVASFAPFWRRIAVHHPRSINLQGSSTHPSTAKRFLAVEMAVQEVRTKRSRGLSLVPEERNQ